MYVVIGTSTNPRYGKGDRRSHQEVWYSARPDMDHDKDSVSYTSMSLTTPGRDDARFSVVTSIKAYSWRSILRTVSRAWTRTMSIWSALTREMSEKHSHFRQLVATTLAANSEICRYVSAFHVRISFYPGLCVPQPAAGTRSTKMAT